MILPPGTGFCGNNFPSFTKYFGRVFFPNLSEYLSEFFNQKEVGTLFTEFSGVFFRFSCIFPSFPEFLIFLDFGSIFEVLGTFLSFEYFSGFLNQN